MNERIGIVGIGFTGRGIATSFLARGFSIKVFDINLPESAEQTIAAYLAELVEHRCADPSILQTWRHSYEPVTSLKGLADCDFVIESVAENIDVKQRVFAELEQFIRLDVPLVTNTSAIPISLMQKSLKHPARFAGMHFAAAAHVSRFVEVIRGDQTNDQTIRTILDIAERAGKKPALVNRDIEGFIVNRLAYAMFREALHLLEQGVADIKTIDRCWRDATGTWGTIAGPFQWMDLTGTSLYAAGMRRIFPTLCNATELPEFMRKLEASGAMEIKNGHGFYTYNESDAQRWNALMREQFWRARAIQEEVDSG